jgi:drug/metabolite transporter (DMT)-like permease
MSRKSSLLEIHAAVFLFGLAGLFGKWLTLSPIIIVLGRVLFASIALAIILWMFKIPLKVSSEVKSFLFPLLGFILAIHWISFFHSIQVSTVAVGLLSFSTYPVFTTFLEPLFFKERVIKFNFFISAVCLLGVFLIIPRFALSNSTFVGVIWGTFSGLTFAVLTVLNRKLTQDLPSLTVAFYQNFFAAIFLLPFILLIRPSLSVQEITLLLVLGVICTAVSHTLFIDGMKFVKAQTASLVHTLEPVYGIIFALLILSEMPSVRTIIGGAVILSGQAVILFQHLTSFSS